MNKSRSSIFLIALMVSSLVLFGAVQFGTAQTDTWNVDSGTYVNGVHNWNPYTSVTDNGTIQIDEPYDQWYVLYTAVPTNDNQGFQISLDVNTQNLQGFLVDVMQNLPMVSATDGFGCGIGPATSAGVFDTQGLPYNGTGYFDVTWNSNGWKVDNLALGELSCNTWYNIVLTVTPQPYNVTGEIFDMNGALLGSYSALDMTSPAFNQLSYIGFGASENGGNYTVNNISITTPQPAPTPTPTPTPTPASNLPTPNLSFNCISSTATTGFNVQIQGSLTYSGVGLSDAGIQLSDSVTGGATWQDLTYVNTDNNGSFSCVWNPSVSGNYGIEATWSGDSDYSNASAVYNFAVAPFNNQGQNVFSVTSNSTLTSLTFDSTTNELSFGVSGPSGTTGLTTVCIPQSLIPDISKLNVMLDGSAINYTSVSEDNVWIIAFTYHHSSHTVVIALGASTSTVPEVSTWIILPLFAIVMLLSIVFIRKRITKK